MEDLVGVRDRLGSLRPVERLKVLAAGYRRCVSMQDPGAGACPGLREAAGERGALSG